MQLFLKSPCSNAAGKKAGTRQLIRASVRLTGCITVFLSLLSSISAAPLKTLPPGEEMVLIKSMFIDNPQFGKDPFFPKSLRRGAVVDNSHTNPEPSFQASSLSLKGISGTVAKRLAIINNRTFEVGEELVLRVANQNFKVRCVEIRDKSVIVSVNGLTQELFLGQHL